MQSLDFYFSSKYPNEKILFVIHRHWFNILIQYIPIFIILTLMVFSFLFYPSLIEDITLPGAQIIFFFLQTFLLLIIWIYGFMIWFDYYLDIWIITSERIVNVEQKGLFSRQVSELQFQFIQDVSTEVQGLFPTVLNYGDVTVQTAAEQSNFIFRSVGNPYKIKGDIMNQIRKKGISIE
jgi:hypothetical protein